MTCIGRNPRCGDPSSSPTPTTTVIDIITAISAIGGAIAGAVKFFGEAQAIAAFFGGAAGAGAVAGALGAIFVIIAVGIHAHDRCIQGDGNRVCVAGVISHLENSFSSVSDEILPFTAMHDRVDVVVKSRFWDIVEDSNAFVHCTDHEFPQRSEIQRCYYFEPRVCEAAQAGVVGAALGGAAGVAAGAAIAAAIGCLTIVLCIVALIVAALVAATAALIGAFIAGQVAKTAAGDTDPTSSGGQPVVVGDLVSVRGNRKLREHDENAGVLWWVSQTDLHGRISDGASRPFTYCDVDDELTSESCPLPDEPIR